jgi:AcrR family transcriptional regulator
MTSSFFRDGQLTEHAESVGEVPRIRADARRNRNQILLAAREIFAEHGPDAPLEEVSRRARVGIGTLYRRFPDRASLLRAVALDVLGRAAHEARLALAEEPTAFQALARYMHRALDLRIGVVMPMLISQIPSEDVEMLRARDEASSPVQKMIDGAQAEGSLRLDVAFADIGLLIIRLARPLPGSFPRTLDDRLAHRHLNLLLDGLRAIGEQSVAPLPGSALSLADLRAMFNASRLASQEHPQNLTADDQQHPENR